MPGSKQQRSKPQRLSRELILEASMQTVENEGLDALSMRRLAQRLDVWPMSIYRYFRDKDELLDALAGSAADALAAPDSSASWRARMHALLGEARHVLGPDRSGVATRLPGILKLSEAGLTILSDAGLEEQRAASAWRALLSYTFGFATTSVREEAGMLRARAAIAALPDDGYPALHAAAPELAAALTADEEFARGLDIVLDGLEAASPGSPSRA
jgi:AcrR family transcriptional regulator